MSGKWFCKSNSGVDAIVKTATYMGGYAVAKNNPVIAVAAVPVANAILKTASDGGDNSGINAIFQEAVTHLVEGSSKDPVVQSAIGGALNALSIDIPTGKFPVLGNEAIKELVESFMAGMTAGTIKL